MSDNLQNLLRESLLNNSYDYTSMHNVLRKTWENSYSYLYALQKSYIEYEDLEYISNNTDKSVKRIGRLYTNKSLDACFDVDYDFIHICTREEFHSSKFYFNTFTFTDMVNNPDIFYKIPIIMIDNQTIWNYKLRVNKETITVILPFKRSFVISTERDPETDELVHLEHDIRIMVVDNIYYHIIPVNRITFESIVSGNNTSNNNKKYNIIINSPIVLNNEKVKDKDGTYFISINKRNTGKDLKSFHGTDIIPCIVENGKLKASVGPKLYDELIKLSGNIYIRILFINKLYSHKLYNGNRYVECDDNKECNMFMLQLEDTIPYAMPIPVEDLIVFKIDNNGDRTLMKSIDVVKLYYPNIYRIIDANRECGDRYEIFYFYHKATYLEYTPIHDYFYRFLCIRYNGKPIEEIVDTIYRGTADFSSFTPSQLSSFKKIFNKILEYQYYNHKYGEIDFHKRYINETENIDKEVVEYKDETLKSWINIDPYVLRDYVIEQDKLYTPVYHLWTNTLNLSSRLRNDTRTELGVEYGFDLDEPCYVFSFRNDNTTYGKLLDARVFVDGLCAHTMVQERHYFTDYFYIPASMVTDDSYIEIEIFPSYSYRSKLEFKSMDDVQTIKLLEPTDHIFPTAEDLYYINPSGHLLADGVDSINSSTDAMGEENTVTISSSQAIAIVGGKTYKETHIYSNDFFEISAKYKDGTFVVKTTDSDKPVKFTRLSEFEVKPLSEDVLNVDLAMAISKIPNSIDVLIEKEGYPYIALVENQFKFNIDYIRVFKNGRLVPKQKYMFFSSYSFPRLFFTDYAYPGDIIHIDITPYRYKEIYYKDKLIEGDVLINLRDIITKPFDIRYYDVYMNGRKLGLNNVWTISPYEITLTNLMSLNNLQIFEKERDWEYFGTNYKTQKYYYSITELFNSTFITDDEVNQIIREMIDEAKEPECNIKPNLNIEDPISFEDDRVYVYMPMFYFNELIPKTYVNPDIKQFDDLIMEEEYPLINSTYRVHPSESHRTVAEKTRRENYPDVLALNPDTYIEGENKENMQYVYSVGHLHDVDNTYINQNIEINNISDIDNK